MTDTDTPKSAEVPKCQLEHGSTVSGLFAGLILALMVWWISILPQLPGNAGCNQFRRHGYQEVSSLDRTQAYLEEFRHKTAYESPVRLYASPFHEAYGWTEPCDGAQIIVLSLEYINTWRDEELRGLMGHEFGHKLVDRHQDPTPPAKTTEEQTILTERNQREADGYGIELVGEADFRAYLKREGWGDNDLKRKLKEGRDALADLRKRAPLIR